MYLTTGLIGSYLRDKGKDATAVPSPPDEGITEIWPSPKEELSRTLEDEDNVLAATVYLFVMRPQAYPVVAKFMPLQEFVDIYTQYNEVFQWRQWWWMISFIREDILQVLLDHGKLAVERHAVFQGIHISMGESDKEGLYDMGIGSKTKDWSYKPFDGPGPTNHSDFSTTQYRFVLVNGLSVAQHNILERTIMTPTFPHSANQLLGHQDGAARGAGFRCIQGPQSIWGQTKSTMQATMADVLDQLEAPFKLQIIDSQKEAGSNRPVDKSHVMALAKEIYSDVIICFGNQVRKVLGLPCQAK
ncbi:hypothetical protein B0H14DRAFT_2577082 [Mycena olivaceomarginata]|nr:hypothetical protein B0H14DRAFT_2577082 [Mycena olivaceomarginata]